MLQVLGQSSVTLASNEVVTGLEPRGNPLPYSGKAMLLFSLLDILGSIDQQILFFPKKDFKIYFIALIKEGEENFVGDSEIIALGGASNETKDRPLG